MAEQYDIDDHMEPVDAHPVQRLRTPAQTGRDGGAGTAREQDPHLSSLVARAQFIVRRGQVARLLEARGASDSGSEGKLAMDDNDLQLISTRMVPAKAVVAELRFALRQLDAEDKAALRRAVEREYQVANRELVDHTGSADVDAGSDDEFVPGPVAAILLDRQIPHLAGDDLAARVVQLLAATKHHTVRRGQRALVVAGAGVLSLGVAATFVFAGAFSMLALMSLVCVAGMLYVIASGLRGRYPQLAIADACALAHLRSNGSLVRMSTVSAARHVDTKAPAGKRVVAAGFDKHLADGDPPSRPTRTARPGLRKPARATPQASPVDRERQIAEVHAAVAELDTEWLEYSLDTHAWFLSKPQLRNNNDPVVAAYRHAQAELRDLAADLTSLSDDAQIAAAQQAARRALAAWGEANTHALKIGVSDLSPSEEAALKRLHGLVNTFNDRSTPKEMWAELKAAIIRTMDKLTVTSFDLSVIADLPVIAQEQRMRALPAAHGDA